MCKYVKSFYKKSMGVDVTCGPTLIPCHHHQWSLTSIKLGLLQLSVSLNWQSVQSERTTSVKFNIFLLLYQNILMKNLNYEIISQQNMQQTFFEWLIMFCDKTINRKAVRQIKSYRINKFNKSKQKTLSDFNIFGHNWKYISFWIL